jgi:hypothetical protein
MGQLFYWDSSNSGDAIWLKCSACQDYFPAYRMVFTTDHGWLCRACAAEVGEKV